MSETTASPPTPPSRDQRLQRWLPMYYLVVLIGNTLIAVLLTALAPGDTTFTENFVHSQAIGLSILSLMMLPRLALPNQGRGPLQWLLFAVSLPVGFVFGAWIASRLLGMPYWLLSAERAGGARLPVIVTIVASASCALFFWSRERVGALQLEAAREHERAEVERRRAESASRLATESRLNLLRTQLEPHMLFNTLANLRSLITLDPPRAQRMMDRLIAYLRATLSASRQDTVPLAAEFALLDDYLSLIAIRMGARLQYRLDLPAELAALRIPPLLLQPLVENAVRHGLEPSIDGGRIDVRARLVQQRLELIVEDSGLGFERPQTGSPTAHGVSPAAHLSPATGVSATGGFGLQQVRERLHALHGEAASLLVRSPRPDRPGEPPGALLTITIPVPRGGTEPAGNGAR